MVHPHGLWHAQRSWTDYRAELARVLSTDEWEAVAVGFVGISVIERRFSERPSGSPFVADDMSVLQHTAKSFYRGINTLRKRQGIEAMTPGMKT